MPKKIRPAKPQPYHHGDLRRALIETALQLVTEEQDWTFSLREVARRAGVSHRAPYNHFPEKLDLLAAVAAVGFERLRDGMLRAMAGIDESEALLAAICRTYIRLGLENPALYRLMFGPALSASGSADRPTVARLAGAEARGGAGRRYPARSPLRRFRCLARKRRGRRHGRALGLVRHARPDDAGDRPDSAADLSIDEMIERLLRIVVTGLRKPRARPAAPRERRTQP